VKLCWFVERVGGIDVEMLVLNRMRLPRKPVYKHHFDDSFSHIQVVFQFMAACQLLAPLRSDRVFVSLMFQAWMKILLKIDL